MSSRRQFIRKKDRARRVDFLQEDTYTTIVSDTWGEVSEKILC